MDHQKLDQRLTSIISWLQEYPEVYAFLYEADKAGSGIFFGDPNHTISYNIAIRAKAGDAWAIAACQVLNLLSPDHCAWALSNEALCRIVP